MHHFSGRDVLLAFKDIQTLKSLVSLLSPLNLRINQTSSVVDATHWCDQHHVDLVIYDINLVDEKGELFSHHLSTKLPHTQVITVVKPADITLVMQRIKEGSISYFIQKPWDEKVLLDLVKRALLAATLVEENHSLSQQLDDSKRLVDVLTTDLEAKVIERTRWLEQSKNQIDSAFNDLKTSYRAIVRMFSTLMFRRMHIKSAPSTYENMNRLLITVAKACGLEGKYLKQIFYAWQLRNIGKISFSDEMLTTPYVQLSVEQQRQFNTHPLLAQAAMFVVKPLYSAGKIVRQHKEYLDGSGYPKQLQGDQIIFSAQVLCVVNDYFELIQGRYQERQLSTLEALSYLKKYAKEKYNPEVVGVLEQSINRLAKEQTGLTDSRVTTADLALGMQLSRDLESIQGVLLLSAGQRLDATTIERIREIEFNLQETFNLYVNLK
jgi:response regulator RpfG family c-di-GMP phosphodiesterase